MHVQNIVKAEAGTSPLEDCADLHFMRIQTVDERGDNTLETQKDKKLLGTLYKNITSAANEPPNTTYVVAFQPAGAQTPYYQEQVAGQPVYVQGSSQSRNAARMQTYQYRRDSNYTSDSFIFMDSFEQQSIRNKFVQKVYTILAIQLIYTCAFISLCIYDENLNKFVRSNLVLLLTAAITEMAIYFSLVCCVSARRVFPINFFLLALFTVAFAYIMGVISTTYKTEIVMMSMGITAGVCLLISVFACQTSVFDITGYGMCLCIMGMVVAIFGFATVIVLIFTRNKLLLLVYAGLIALVFSLYLMFDTQMIMGGRRVELSPEEYIFAALTLYVDIMEIFWAILTILGLTRD